jgi:hypothetical protein
MSGHQLTTEVVGSTATILDKGIERVGLIDDGDADDPTLVIWRNDGEAALIIHLHDIDWNTDNGPRLEHELRNRITS